VVERRGLLGSTVGYLLFAAKKQTGPCRSRLWWYAGRRSPFSLAPRPAGLCACVLFAVGWSWVGGPGLGFATGCCRNSLPFPPLWCRRAAGSHRVRFRSYRPGGGQGSRNSSRHRAGRVRPPPRIRVVGPREAGRGPITCGGRTKNGKRGRYAPGQCSRTSSLPPTGLRAGTPNGPRTSRQRRRMAAPLPRSLLATLGRGGWAGMANAAAGHVTCLRSRPGYSPRPGPRIRGPPPPYSGSGLPSVRRADRDARLPRPKNGGVPGR